MRQSAVSSSLASKTYLGVTRQAEAGNIAELAEVLLHLLLVETVGDTAEVQRRALHALDVSHILL